jgi:acyl-CoA reductase-like NAD-dependent aldehyde dehydrogenase
VSALRVVNPATEEPIADLPQADVADADAAVARARNAFPAWRAVSPVDRARLLRGLATLVEEHGEELARIESRNVGKPTPVPARRWRWWRTSSTSTQAQSRSTTVTRFR